MLAQDKNEEEGAENGEERARERNGSDSEAKEAKSMLPLPTKVPVAALKVGA